MMFTVPRLSIAAFTIAVLSQRGFAEIVQYVFAGEITNITFNQNNVLGNLSVGDPFAGSVAFDLAVPDANPDPTIGDYSQNGLMAVTLPEFSLEYMGHLLIGVLNASSDSFGATVDNVFGDYNITNFGIDLDDSTGSAFSSDALPEKLDLSQFDTATFILAGLRVSTSDPFIVAGVVNSLVMIPGPGLGLIGFLAVTSSLRSRQRQSRAA